ncbi:MAG: serine/threonine-protein kinase, partial [Bacteroidota bacterium]
MSWAEIKRLFEAASDLPADQRRSFLDAECPADLRAEVDALLAADDEDDAFMDAPAVEAVTLGRVVVPLALETGQQVGPYKLLSELGRGGMGVVYLAERADGTYRQRVALKLVRADGAQMTGSRFRAERQILARLAHPNIARLLDGGLSGPVPGAPDGLPYLVMEYVAGEPLTQYADRRRLGVQDRLNLFQQVCDAVAFAHQNLVVHRDLKPGNILVEETDEGPGRVKLLDFGIAKLLDETEEDAPFITRTAGGLMTPAYAAPEQVRGTGVTTATDIYALGVILYELLTGRRPYETAGLSPAELERVICDADPSRPSTVATRLVDADATREVTPEDLAEMRSTEPSQLSSTLSGDLDAIILKALAKEPVRRYPAAGDFGDDLRRHMRGEPVEAREPTWGYRANRFVKRHKLGVVSAAAVALLLVTVAVLAVQSAVTSNRQAETIARERDRAQTEADKAARTVAFLQEMLGAADPDAGGRDVTVRSVLDSAIVRLDTALVDQPEVRAAVLYTVGKTSYALGLYDRARPLLEESVELLEQAEAGPGSDLPAYLNDLALLYRESGDVERSLELDLRALALMRQAHETDSVRAIGTALNNIGNSYYSMGRIAEADSFMRQALAVDLYVLGENHPYVAIDYNNLGTLAGTEGRFEESLAYYRSALEIYEAQEDPSNPSLYNTLFNVAVTEQDLGQFAEAEATYQRVISSRQRYLGEEHPATLNAEANYALLLFENGQVGASRERLTNLIPRMVAAVGDEHPRYANMLVTLSRLEAEAGALDEARRHAQRAQEIWEGYWAEHYNHGIAWSVLGAAKLASGEQEP